MKKLLALLLLFCVSISLKALPDVPEKLTFCNIELSLDHEARATIAETVEKLQKSKVYFQAMTDRANIYLPFVSEAFQLRGVPQDLKYIVIQESALVGDAVSSSNAVGFWQFKTESAKEAGLTIDNDVDERKHIFLSSLAAAKYFYTIAKWYDNYLYAVIGYKIHAAVAISIQLDEG
jgi:membrane-bound lytic murein transglycosylase D